MGRASPPANPPPVAPSSWARFLPQAGGVVRCVVVSAVEGGAARMVRLPGGALITPWHPVLVLGSGGSAAWRFPCELATPAPVPIDEFFNVVLEEENKGRGSGAPAPAAACLVIGGVHCAALGHGLLAGPVIGHAYFGSGAVLRDLQAADPEGWAAGRVRLGVGVRFQRDAESGRVVGLDVAAAPAAVPVAAVMLPESSARVGLHVCEVDVR